MGNNGFIMLQRGDETRELLKNSRAFTLLTVIALRARRTDSYNVDGLNPGESLIGDHATIGLTRQEYRTALDHLRKAHFITARATNRGTIAKLADERIYDINLKAEQPPKQPDSNHQTTIKQPSNNQQPTTNNNGNNGIMRVWEEITPPADLKISENPPSPEDVRQYAREISYPGIDAEKFCNHYEAMGWKSNGQQITDWKAQVRKWKDTEKNRPPATNGQADTGKRPNTCKICGISAPYYDYLKAAYCSKHKP